MEKRFRGRPRLTILQDLLCSEAKKVDFHVNSVGDTSSILTAIDSRIGAPVATETITTRTLDDAAEALQGNVGLLKIDVQGAELEVLKGGEKTLARTEFVWIEVSFKPLYQGSALFDDIQAHMQKKGFILFNLMPASRGKDGELLQADCLYKKRLMAK